MKISGWPEMTRGEIGRTLVLVSCLLTTSCEFPTAAPAGTFLASITGAQKFTLAGKAGFAFNDNASPSEFWVILDGKEGERSRGVVLVMRNERPAINVYSVGGSPTTLTFSARLSCAVEGRICQMFSARGGGTVRITKSSASVVTGVLEATMLSDDALGSQEITVRATFTAVCDPQILYPNIAPCR
jgi:hypothetical protein